ncbi:MAG: hypothetical protein P8163_16285 [Candidatus Thiodiazotropha sp.]
MDKNKLLVALYFGMVAHFALPLGAFIVGIGSEYPVRWETTDIPGYASWFLFDPVFWAGAIGGYLLGVKICISYTESWLGFIKSILVGLAITLLASAMLGLFGGISSIFTGKGGVLELVLSPITGIFGFAFFTLGTIYVVGSVSALILHVGCWGRKQLTR